MNITCVNMNNTVLLLPMYRQLAIESYTLLSSYDGLYKNSFFIFQKTDTPYLYLESDPKIISMSAGEGLSVGLGLMHLVILTIYWYQILLKYFMSNIEIHDCVSTSLVFYGTSAKISIF